MGRGVSGDLGKADGGRRSPRALLGHHKDAGFTLSEMEIHWCVSNRNATWNLLEYFNQKTDKI